MRSTGKGRAVVLRLTCLQSKPHSELLNPFHMWASGNFKVLGGRGSQSEAKWPHPGAFQSLSVLAWEWVPDPAGEGWRAELARPGGRGALGRWLSLLNLTRISPDPVAEQEARIIGPGVPLPLRPASLSFSPSGHVDGILQYPPQEGGEAGSWQLSVPPIASPPMPLTPVVCPNDRLALVSQGNPAQSMWMHLGKGRLATVATGLGATGSGPPPSYSPSQVRPDTWLRDWLQPSTQPLAGIPRNTATQLRLPFSTLLIS